MLLSTLSISSHGFALSFPKRPHTNGDVFHTYKPRSFLQSMWDLTIYPLRRPTLLLARVTFSHQCGTPPKPPFRGSTSLLAHHPMSDFNIICNRPSPSLVDIILQKIVTIVECLCFVFGFLKVFKTCLLEVSTRFPHSYKVCFVLLPTDVGSHIFVHKYE